ncbi:hypothetical protein FB558_5822 [Pseudonocardia kunmingensis]|uniref:Uncharacterized protein n=1 Tax=Pseudonocardia kunmingensis TaxID=630975 RepID=A0A543DL53_9PSEU|nr:hypothetical protein FB558_5822 [Pseudonocardia kunmingensis]
MSPSPVPVSEVSPSPALTTAAAPAANPASDDGVLRVPGAGPSYSGVHSVVAVLLVLSETIGRHHTDGSGPHVAGARGRDERRYRGVPKSCVQ